MSDDYNSQNSPGGPNPPPYGQGGYGPPPASNNGYPPPPNNPGYPPPAGNNGYPPPPNNYGYPPPPNNPGYPPPAPGYGQPPYGQPQPPYAGPPSQPPPYVPPRPTRPRSRLRPLFYIIGIVAIITVVITVLSTAGVFNTVNAPDYPGATKSSLTDKGMQYVNSIYKSGSSDVDNRKVFVTSDPADRVFTFYKAQLPKNGWTFDKEGDLDGTGGTFAANGYTKNKQALYVIADDSSNGLVKNADGKTCVIIITGDKSN